MNSKIITQAIMATSRGAFSTTDEILTNLNVEIHKTTAGICLGVLAPREKLDAGFVMLPDDSLSPCECGRSGGLALCLSEENDRIALRHVPGNLDEMPSLRDEFEIAVRHALCFLQSRKRNSDQVSRLEIELAIRTKELEATLAEVTTANETLRRAQTQLLQIEKMAALGQLAAGVAHEINNPISYISSNIATAQQYWKTVLRFVSRLKTAHPESVAQQEKALGLDAILGDMGDLLNECSEGTQRVTGIVKSLKEFAYQRPAELVLADIHDVIDRSVTIALSPYKHRIAVLRSYNGPAKWRCDISALSQIVLNLIVNAAQAINGAGQITIATTADEEGRFRISIKDTGCGIPSENLQKIFEPFFTTKDVGVGTGLGLSTCFHLVTQMGGKISAESTANLGATFVVSLPEPSVRQTN